MPGGVAVLGLAALALGALALSHGSKEAPKPAGGAPTSGTFEFDPNLPPQLEAQALGAIKLGTAAELRTFADQLDAMGYHLTAAALRQRAAELAPAPHAVPPAVPFAPPPSAPGPTPFVPSASAAPPSPAPTVIPSGPPIPPLVVPAPSPATPPPPPSPPPPGGLSGLDATMDAQTRQAVIAALTTETDPAKLQGFAASLQAQYPIAAGLLWAKSAAMIAQQTPLAVPALPAAPTVPSVVLPSAPPVVPPPGVIHPSVLQVPPPPALAPSGYTWKLATDADVARDGTQPRYQALLSSPLGTEVQEMHNGRLWKFRVVSNTTDPSLTTFAKDVKAWIAALIPGDVSAPPAPSAVVPVTPPSTMTNQDVQRALNQLGFALPPLVVDGVIGPKSKAAVIAFQQAHGLTVDGIPGPQTKAALQATLARQGGAAPALPSVATLPSVPIGPPSVPSTVATNQDVQRALNQLGFALPPLVVDGVIGPKSKAAVIAFQQAHGLTVDGIPGPQTKAALQAALAALGGMAA